MALTVTPAPPPLPVWPLPSGSTALVFRLGQVHLSSSFSQRFFPFHPCMCVERFLYAIQTCRKKSTTKVYLSKAKNCPCTASVKPITPYLSSVMRLCVKGFSFWPLVPRTGDESVLKLHSDPWVLAPGLLCQADPSRKGLASPGIGKC